MYDFQKWLIGKEEYLAKWEVARDERNKCTVIRFHSYIIPITYTFKIADNSTTVLEELNNAYTILVNEAKFYAKANKRLQERGNNRNSLPSLPHETQEVRQD